ncbi:hypothetical protein PS914_05836 [Pseudomonas fluorescens]|nr:hypothetical protein PS914_05836 [Pseudomonas fluorescens]
MENPVVVLCREGTRDVRCVHEDLLRCELEVLVLHPAQIQVI